ncbi:argonaute/piwi family protein [Burkholderia vietnamiensis]|uniref:argonaute/piwi family protein n=1 Tax=Burkholderia vietnamiensis TaxID=60552 RepID=UPI001592D466|nr:Piwi domain-containing protein [Burkholderia vietnamiensis]
MPRLLQLNFTPLQVAGKTIRLQRLAFEGREQLQELRGRYRGQFAFSRRADSVIALPLLDVESIAQEEAIEVDDNLDYIRPLLEQRLVSLLSENRRFVERYNPITAIGRTLPTGVKELDAHLHLQSRVLISIRSLKVGAARRLGLLWDLEIQKSISTSVNVLLELGFELTGLVVERESPSDDQRMLPRRRLVGRIGSIEGDEAVLSERFQNVEVHHPLAELYLEPSPENIRFLVQRLVGRSANRVLAKMDEIVFANSRGSARKEHIARISDWMSSLGPVQLQPGLSVTVGALLTERSTDFPRFDEANTPTYIFDAGSQKSATSAVAGLGKYGPYSRHVFTPTRPNVCVVCNRKCRGEFEKFLRKLKDGMTVDGKEFPFGRGMLGIYGLQDITLTFVEADDFTADAYHSAAAKAVRMSAEGDPWHLAIIQSERESRQLPPRQNPYLVAKAAFLSNQIPTQFVAIETLAMPPGNLVYTLSNLALALYAKLGGIPWLIKSDRAIAHEVVIGLGSAAIGESRFSKKERIVGITSVFRGDGGYLLSNLSNAVPIAKYSEALTESLQATLQRVRTEMNWMKGDSVRVVVHAFKPMRNIEIESLKAALREFSEFDLQFAFVYVKQDHPYLLFDDGQPGVKGRGDKTPIRGLYAEIGEYESLLTLTGPRELKRATDGLPKPLLLNLHRDSTFKDLVYLTKQVYWFSSHSWRSFLPAALPVTIYYSDLVAGLLGRLDRLGNRWSPSVMLGKIGTTRWFL